MLKGELHILFIFIIISLSCISLDLITNTTYIVQLINNKLNNCQIVNMIDVNYRLSACTVAKNPTREQIKKNRKSVKISYAGRRL